MILFLFITLAIIGCSKKVVLKNYAIRSLNYVIDDYGIKFDEKISFDGNGSISINADTSKTYHLYEIGDLDIEDTTIFYEAFIKTENLNGEAYLEMVCDFPAKGSFYSRATQQKFTGTNDWTCSDTPFLLKKGENPNNIFLNLVVEGTGKIWIDDIKLYKK